MSPPPFISTNCPPANMPTPAASSATPLPPMPIRPRPATAYEQFTDHIRPQLPHDNYPSDQTDARILLEWCSLPAETKNLWVARYDEQIAEYKLQCQAVESPAVYNAIHDAVVAHADLPRPLDRTQHASLAEKTPAHKLAADKLMLEADERSVQKESTVVLEQNAALRSDIDALHATIRGLASENASWESAFSMLEADVRDLRERNGMLRGEKEALQSNVDALHAMIRSLAPGNAGMEKAKVKSDDEDEREWVVVESRVSMSQVLRNMGRLRGIVK